MVLGPSVKTHPTYKALQTCLAKEPRNDRCDMNITMNSNLSMDLDAMTRMAGNHHEKMMEELNRVGGGVHIEIKNPAACAKLYECVKSHAHPQASHLHVAPPPPLAPLSQRCTDPPDTKCQSKCPCQFPSEWDSLKNMTWASLTASDKKKYASVNPVCFGAIEWFMSNKKTTFEKGYEGIRAQGATYCPKDGLWCNDPKNACSH